MSSKDGPDTKRQKVGPLPAYAYRSGPDYPVEEPRKTEVLKGGIDMGFFERYPAVEFFDIDSFQRHCKALTDAGFPPNTLHSIACKANPTAKVLTMAGQAGLGCETASLPEMIHATRCGFPSSGIIFDSPSKTKIDIEKAFELGVWLNADNFMELDIINDIINSLHKPLSSTQVLGLRVNIQTSLATGDQNSNSITSTPTSKFGVGLQDNRDEILQSYLKYPWLNAFHVHCGSQGVDIPFLVNGAKEMFQLLKDVNALREKKGGMAMVTNLDIGGGLETDYCGDKTTGRFAEYARQLKEGIPELWSGKYRLATEFGRALTAKSAFAASRVEYTKNTGGRNIATTHVGADYHVRAAYLRGLWMPKISVYDSKGQHKSEEKIQAGELTDIAGPLCFSGDLMVKGIAIPPVARGDMVMVHDTGAYTMAMWSRYNSRMAPPVVGFRSIKSTAKASAEGVTTMFNGTSDNVENNGFAFKLMKRGETVDDVLAFWH